MINFTGNKATAVMRALGVIDISEEANKKLIELLRFDSHPTDSELYHRAGLIVEHCKNIANELGYVSGFNMAWGKVLVKSPPFLTTYIEYRMAKNRFAVHYPFLDKQGKLVGFIESKSHHYQYH